MISETIYIPIVCALINNVANTAANRTNIARSSTDIHKLNIFGLTGLFIVFAETVRDVEFGPVAFCGLIFASDLSSNRLSIQLGTIIVTFFNLLT